MGYSNGVERGVPKTVLVKLDSTGEGDTGTSSVEVLNLETYNTNDPGNTAEVEWTPEMIGIIEDVLPHVRSNSRHECSVTYNFTHLAYVLHVSVTEVMLKVMELAAERDVFTSVYDSNTTREDEYDPSAEHT